MDEAIIALIALALQYTPTHGCPGSPRNATDRKHNRIHFGADVPGMRR
jgi:hypothetical protein